MNGRSYPAAATAVDRASGPVLAWNVEATQFPAGGYPEMPAAAAAAVSPVVPAASAAAAPPDPYGRCWQNQVDPSACFPYFGTLYGTSLPPPSYRMQPGCLSNLGQFWPPTPPPEGCVRYDGTNNLHYCSPLTPVFRHTESLPQNMLGVQRLGHYTHLIDINKDPAHKRLDPCMDGMQRQKFLQGSKHSKEPQQRTCSCYECNERTSTHGVTQSVNKENISSTSKLLEQKYSEEKLNKLKPCRRVKEDIYPHSRSSLVYHPNASAITSYNCSVEPNIARTTPALHGPGLSEYITQQKLENPISSSSCVQHDFVRPENNSSYPGSRCAPSNTYVSAAPAKDMTQMVYSTAKSSEQSRIDISGEKLQRHKLHVSTPGYDPYPSVQTPASSTSYRSSDNSCCFSPPFVSSRTLYHNYPENSSHSKTPNMLMMYGNGYNASPLKNVYFSYYESENADMGSTTPSNRRNKSNYGKVEKLPNLNDISSHIATPLSQNSFCIPSASSPLNSKPHRRVGGSCDSNTVPSDTSGYIYQACNERQNGTNASNCLDSSKHIFSDQVPKLNFIHIKQEKVENTDCKFQKPADTSSRNSRISDIPETVLNLTTSIHCPKVEPSEHVSISATEPINTSVIKTSVATMDGYSQNLDSGYISGSALRCHEVLDATTPQMHDCTPAVPEDLGPMAQTAPCGGAELASMSKMPTTGYEAPFQIACQSEDSNERSASSNLNSCLTSASECVSNVPLQQKDCHKSVGKEAQDLKLTASVPDESITVHLNSLQHDDRSTSDVDGDNSPPALVCLKTEQVETTSETAPPADTVSLSVEEPKVEVKKEVVLDSSLDYSSQPPTETEDCHGLYVLLQGIAQKTNTESLGNSEAQNTSSNSPSLVKSDKSRMKGLNLLCALAEEQFRTEFVENKLADCNDNAALKLSSNYPSVKEEIPSEPLIDEAIMNAPETSITTELTMRKKLAELQQIYKEKQKELARLKPKKGSSSDATCASRNSSPFSNCSKENNLALEENNKKSCRENDESPDRKSHSETSNPKPAKITKTSIEESEDKPLETLTNNGNIESKTISCKTMAQSNKSSSLKRKKMDLKRNSSRKMRKFASRTRKSTPKKMPTVSESDANEESRKVSKRPKKYSKHKRHLNHFMRSLNGKDGDTSEEFELLNVQMCMKSPKKRKAENPKRFMPSKQVRLTETIVAKQLRNRILFEEPEFSEKSEDKSYDVPEALFDALRKCNLGESKADDIVNEPVSSPTMPKLTAESVVVQLPRVMERQLRMSDENLLENQRILAIEEGLFYAGCIREIQSNNVFAIVLDGQRGNKKHLFSKEEMLTQTILESKPDSLADLPEGTRVCAFWSHQYRCLYPGTVMKAPTPSADWSEPRVFVEFDDGDSAQIAMKNIRFLPPDMTIAEEDDDSGCGNTSLDSKDGSSLDSNESEEHKKKKKRRKTDDIKASERNLNSELSDFAENKANNHCSNGRTAGDLSSPSHALAQQTEGSSKQESSTLDTKASSRKQMSKQKSSNKTKLKDGTSTSKKHKKYKERHKHHHHHRHHHRHHRHCHHHRHCKKRKHHKRTSNTDSNIINVVIPSSSIPLSHLATRSSMKDSESQCLAHSKKHLPQPCEDAGDSKSSTKEKNSKKANR